MSTSTTAPPPPPPTTQALLEYRNRQLENQSRDYAQRLRGTLDVTSLAALRMALEKVGRTIKNRGPDYQFVRHDRNVFVTEFADALQRRTMAPGGTIRRLFRAFNPSLPAHRQALREALSFAETDQVLFECLWRLTYRIDDFKDHKYQDTYTSHGFSLTFCAGLLPSAQAILVCFGHVYITQSTRKYGMEPATKSIRHPACNLPPIQTSSMGPTANSDIQHGTYRQFRHPAWNLPPTPTSRIKLHPRLFQLRSNLQSTLPLAMHPTHCNSDTDSIVHRTSDFNPVSIRLDFAIFLQSRNLSRSGGAGWIVRYLESLPETKMRHLQSSLLCCLQLGRSTKSPYLNPSSSLNRDRSCQVYSDSLVHM
ncbi:hypothetical protein BJ508DRAFT_308237 [Ascobolus immersus RN42]|uniref:Uncharacterized protein n=1 Tax=Ascobolus immersus RN42 TaxID=1160509 RepID=A0A3N4I626_ASCIM|nr:hypothetical protein BJ508DRAFT_308237 [Ascobolus immersus RN42]